VRAHAESRPGPTSHPRHDRLQSRCPRGCCGVASAGVHGPCGPSRGRAETRCPRGARGRDQHRGQNGGDGIGSSGDQPQTGEQVIALTDHNGSVLSPLPVAPVHEPARILLPEGLKAVKRVANTVGLTRTGAYLHLDAGVDSTPNRTGMVNAGMLPTITEHPRTRKRTKRGRKRVCHATIQALRPRVDRSLAWEETFKRLLLRFEHLQQRHCGMTLRAYTWIHVREFCGAYNSQPVPC
jgi:hypothetical protein